MTQAREVFDESLVDAAESGDSAFPSGDFSVCRSRRPFSASQSSEQLSLVSASREGPINFPLNFQAAEHVGHWWQIERAQNKFTSVGAIMHEPFPPLLKR